MSGAVLRGDIWWVEFDPARGSEIRKRRPAVVLTTNAVARARRTVVVVPLTTGPTARPPLVVATPSAGEGSMAACDQLRAVDKSRLTEKRGTISDADLKAIEGATRLILEL